MGCEDSCPPAVELRMSRGCVGEQLPTGFRNHMMALGVFETVSQLCGWSHVVSSSSVGPAVLPSQDLLSSWGPLHIQHEEWELRYSCLWVWTLRHSPPPVRLATFTLQSSTQGLTQSVWDGA